MKKSIKQIVIAVVLALGVLIPISPHVAAQEDATYSCGAYGAGSYSNNDCVEDVVDEGGGGATSGGDGSNAAHDDVSPDGGSGSGDNEDDTSESESEPAAEEVKTDGNMFAVLFAKLAASWGWLVFFGLLIVAGMVILGVVGRRRKNRGA